MQGKRQDPTSSQLCSSLLSLQAERGRGRRGEVAKKGLPASDLAKEHEAAASGESFAVLSS